MESVAYEKRLDIQFGRFRRRNPFVQGRQMVSLQPGERQGEFDGVLHDVADRGELAIHGDIAFPVASLQRNFGSRSYIPHSWNKDRLQPENSLAPSAPADAVIEQHGEQQPGYFFPRS
jgi:hypothetical protein